MTRDETSRLALEGAGLMEIVGQQGVRVRLIPRSRSIAIGEKRVRLEPQVYAILWLLMLHASVSYDMITDSLWTNPDQIPEDWWNIIRVRIYKLRKALIGTNWSIERTGPQRYSLVPV